MILSRKLDESIRVGEDIVITVVDIRGDRVRLGIAAPNDVPVHRTEVYDAIQRDIRAGRLVRVESYAGRRGEGEGQR